MTPDDATLAYAREHLEHLRDCMFPRRPMQPDWRTILKADDELALIAAYSDRCAALIAEKPGSTWQRMLVADIEQFRTRIAMAWLAREREAKP